MKYQIRANLYFSDEAPLRAIKEALLRLWSQALVINAETPDQEASEIEGIQNFHDEHPSAPCFQIFSIKKLPLHTPTISGSIEA